MDHETRYQVFVSSTFRDLQPEREKALQAVLELQAFPSGMELFPSADDEQFEFIKREIESSDYYVVIVAGKYGSLAPDGLSFTEKEYDYAVSLGKPVLGFLFHSLDDLKGEQLERESGKQQKVEAFRAKVRSKKLVKFFHNPDELKSQIFQALFASFRSHPQEGWVRAKNARRIEDLEQINALQKEIARLNALVEDLRDSQQDSNDEYAQGSDLAEWVVALKDFGASPPIEEFKLSMPWNELLVSCFPNGNQQNREENIINILTGLVHERMSPFLEFDWVKASRTNDSVIVGKVVERILPDIKTQFLGLALIELVEFGAKSTWVLSSKGTREIFAMKGIRRRANASPDS